MASTSRIPSASNFAHPSGVSNFFSQDWGIQIIRAAMGVEAGGYLDRPERECLAMAIHAV